MMYTFSLSEGVTLRCIPDRRFKHACLSIQLLRPMCREEAAANALLPAVLLRGCKSCPDLRQIIFRLDDLYGASIGSQVRRVGDYQTTGLYASFLEDRYAMEGDAVLSPTVEFMKELLLQSELSGGIFRKDYVESEKKNLISVIEAQRNDKSAYAMDALLRRMCREDSYGISRLGEIEDVRSVTAESLFAHYQKILKESPVEILYVGSAQPEEVARLVKPIFGELDRDYVNLPAQTALLSPPGGYHSESMDVNQGKLCMGFATPITLRDGEFAAMQMLNMIFGGGMTGKLFMQLRERMSLCYAIHSGYHGAKGILTVSAGIDFHREDTVRKEILRQLELCRQGEITEEEMTAAREALRSSLLAVHDSPGSIESYYASAALSGLKHSPAQYIRLVEQVTVEQVARAAQSLTLHTEFFLKGANP